jgi:ornithine cyclodeaminase
VLSLSRDLIIRHFDFAGAAEAIREAYVACSQGLVTLPPVGHIRFVDANGDCHIKAGHIHGQPIFVVKIATGFYDNPARGLPSSNGIMLAFSAETGAPVATLNDEGWLTDMRTGIGGALATRALAQPTEREVLVVGTGIQCRVQAQCLAQLAPDAGYRFTVWGRTLERAETTVEDMTRMGLPAKVAVDLAEAVGQARIIITTTPSSEPLILSDWVRPGTHVTAIGADSPGKQELDVELVSQADLAVCDLASQSLDHGEFQHAHAAGRLKGVVELGLILSGDRPGRRRAEEITVADLTGIAPQDIAITASVLATHTHAKDKK